MIHMNEPDELHETDDEEEAWKDILFQEEQKEQEVHLELEDYVALFIAALQTVFLPLLILMAVLIGAGLLLSIMF